MSKPYNSLLVEFDFLVDMDLALWRYFRDKYRDSEYVDKDIINLNDEWLVEEILLARTQSNVLELLLPNYDTMGMYNDLLSKQNLPEVLKYATAYDTLALMVTYLKITTDIDISILCRNKIEEDFIVDLCPILSGHTIVGNRFEQDLDSYTVLYVKHISYCLEYFVSDKLNGKNIYIAHAGYNMEPGKPCTNIALTKLFSDTNSIETIDLYTNIKYSTEQNTSSQEEEV